jgi:hypothetical protein
VLRRITVTEVSEKRRDKEGNENSAGYELKQHEKWPTHYNREIA